MAAVQIASASDARKASRAHMPCRSCAITEFCLDFKSNRKPIEHLKREVAWEMCIVKYHSGCRLDNGLKRHKRENRSGSQEVPAVIWERRQLLDQSHCSKTETWGLGPILQRVSMRLGDQWAHKVKE